MSDEFEKYEPNALTPKEKSELEFTIKELNINERMSKKVESMVHKEWSNLQIKFLELDKKLNKLKSYEKDILEYAKDNKILLEYVMNGKNWRDNLSKILKDTERNEELAGVE